ncbi:PucR family transcriptional regulator [Sphaerisporangium fuscum]|uniref:PucR family transcriptional regulator n=1 Tax=Sphaerisporangium fuscum TaxID=2835868 RepID=UPI001BDC523D|nr:PucR family transcriptional regulator [Sphaerisporangium fuscum]
MVADDVQEVLEALARAVGRGVSVDDPDGRVIAHSAHHGETDIDPVRARAILSRTVPADVGEWQRAHGVGTATGPVRVPANAALAMGARLCVSLLHRGRRLGYLWVIEGERPLSAAEIDRVERDAATLAALLDVPATPGGAGRTLRRLLTGGPDARRQAAAELLDHGFTVGDRAYRVIVTHPPATGGEVSAGGIVPSPEGLRRLLAGTLHGLRPPAAHSLVDGRTVILAVDGTPPGAAAPGAVAGVSAPHTGLAEAPDAYREALAAFRAAVGDPAIGPVAIWPEIGVYRFFGDRAERRPEASGGPLARLRERDPRGVLAATLEAYLDSGGDAQATAEAAHLHRTSLYYRLRRIEEITGRDLRDGRHRLELHLALKLARWNATD